MSPNGGRLEKSRRSGAMRPGMGLPLLRVFVSGACSKDRHIEGCDKLQANGVINGDEALGYTAPW